MVVTSRSDWAVPRSRLTRLEMANFEAQVRTTYRDVAGLVLSCVRDDVVVDPTNPGFVLEWINRAPGLPSKPAIRNPGDPAPTYLGGRFSNPKQTDQALQPALALTGGGDFRVQFDRARSTFLVTELLADELPDGDSPLACAYQFTKGGDASNNQVILDATATLIVSRRNAAGDAEVDDSTSLTTVAGDHADGTFVYTGQAASTSLWERDGAAYGTGASDPLNSLEDSAPLHIGRNLAGNYLDGTLDSIHLWAMELSPLTIDFIWQTLNQDGTDFATQLRGPMNNVIWTDLTGDALLDQFNRLRPQTGFPHRYIRVDLPNAPAPHRVQVAAAVNGIVEPDANLGGELFTYSFAEIPGPPFITPSVIDDVGWSAIADFDLDVEGHYTLVVSRLNGGGVVLHFDVQVAPP